MKDSRKTKNKNKNKNRYRDRRIWLILPAVLLLILTGILLGIASNRNKQEEENSQASTTKQEEASLTQKEESGLSGESAKDAEVDFSILREENPDVFAWIYIPGTRIDEPVLQSEESDAFYEGHDRFGNENLDGAVYTEMANMKSMCDFNTVLHGKSAEGQPFSDLFLFASPDFFENHEQIYLYIDGNLLTYTVFAAFEREDSSLIRTYDFTYVSGCQAFLDDLYTSRNMGKLLRQGWEDVTPYHFLITLTTKSQSDPSRQFVVVAALVDDAAGTIDRAVLE